ncbi:MAG: AAA family ATPase [Coriobacteriales bacterium]|nr:AAA family ATPase [Coriobacteriales bacterium]
MKKRNVINLIRYYSEHNDPAFRTEAYEIARDFDASGDYQLAEYIMALLSDTNTFVPQTSSDSLDTDFLQKLPHTKTPLPLPKPIADDVRGVINAVGHNAGVNKFIFQGPPGTGKTETARQVSRVLGREALIVDFSSVIDSKLGQTSKNIVALFDEINGLANQGGYVVLFDEIDALALDRTDSRDVREMGRATSTFLRELERIDAQMVMIATTNLFKRLDKAIVRRFDAVIDFNRYTRDDLIDIAEKITNNLLAQFDYAGKNTRLLRKIVMQADEIPMPGDLTNMIRTSLAFSDPGSKHSYLQRLYRALVTNPTDDIRELKGQGYTLREIEILTGVSKSTASREMKEAL